MTPKERVPWQGKETEKKNLEQIMKMQGEVGVGGWSGDDMFRSPKRG